MEYYSAIKMKEIVPFAEMWVYLEIVIQTEVSQRKKNKYYKILAHGLCKQHSLSKKIIMWYTSVAHSPCTHL